MSPLVANRHPATTWQSAAARAAVAETELRACVEAYLAGHGDGPSDEQIEEAKWLRAISTELMKAALDVESRYHSAW